MNSRNKKHNHNGFALVTVLMMIGLLVIMMTSIILMTSASLYNVNRQIKESHLISIAESAITEVTINLDNNINWGKNNERLFMRTGKQDLTAGGLIPSSLPVINSSFSFDDIGCYYYISFDPNDPAFQSGGNFYSVNNLDGDSSVPNWRGKPVPPHTADILITVGKDDKVKHVECLITGMPQTPFKSGSRGKINIKSSDFTMKSICSSPVTIHSNYNDPNDPNNISVNIKCTSDINNNGTISGCADVVCKASDVSDPNSIKSNQPSINIPALPVSTLISGITFEPVTLPSGTYIAGASKLKYYKDGKNPSTDQPDTIYSDGEIIPGVKLDGNDLIISKNISVNYIVTQTPGSTGNLTIKGIGDMNIKDGMSIYAPGDGLQDPNTGTYNCGNIVINGGSDVLYGQGNLYSTGSMTVKGSDIQAGSNNDSIAIYAGGDVSINVDSDTYFRGLIYSNGNFNLAGSDFTLEGAMIIAGKDPSVDPAGAKFSPGVINASLSSDMDYRYNDACLASLSGDIGVGSFKMLCWYEF